MHPDSAWSPWYSAPVGIEGERCRHGPGQRMRVLVDSCGWCGRIMRSVHDLSWREYDWVRRWNRRVQWLEDWRREKI